MKRLILALPLLCGACTAAQIQAAGTNAQSLVQVVQPLESQAACLLQSEANKAGAVATIAGKIDAAAGASLASQALGIFCNGLAAGSVVSIPATSPAVAIAVPVKG